jgi:hypothetical protein
MQVLLAKVVENTAENEAGYRHGAQAECFLQEKNAKICWEPQFAPASRFSTTESKNVQKMQSETKIQEDTESDVQSQFDQLS